MEGSKTFFISGATGDVGSAIVHHLQENGYQIRALVRNPASAKASKLKHPHIDIVNGDLNDAGSYKQHMKNIEGAFALFTYAEGVKKEIAQGKALIDAAKEMNVPFILYSSVIGADAGTGIPHWESKNEIEQYLKSSGIPYAIVRPASFFQNFFIPDVHKRIKKGKLVSPVRKDKVQQFIDTEDVGRICAHILMNKEKFTGRTVTIAADQKDMLSVAQTFTNVLGKPVKFSQLPGFLTRIFLGSDLYTMFSFINKNDVLYIKNLDAVKTEFPFLTPMKDWIANNRFAFTS